MTVKQIVEACGGTLLHGDEQAPLTGISLNSREVKEHDLFVPLIGERVDAHRFVEQALEAGAGAVLTAEHNQVPDGWNGKTGDGIYEKAWIAVSDTKKALQDIGRYCRSRLTLPLVGVTGSVGKTTTREMIAAALSAGFQVYKTPGNLNSQVGLPVTISEIKKEDEIGVIELGMSEPGELTIIAQIARIHMAVITNIGIAHIEQLGSQENILREKLTIQDGMEEGGILFLNGDDELLKDITAKAGCRTIYYGTGANSQYRAENISMNEGYAQFTAVCGEKQVDVKLHVPGRHQVLNAMVALAVADQNGVDLEKAARALEEFGGFKNRQQIHEMDDFTLIDDTYNASPVTMCGAIDILVSMKKAARRVAVLADMKELGPESCRYHREVGEYLGKLPVDLLVTYGELAKSIEDGALNVNPSLKAVHFSDKQELMQWLKGEKKPGDCILLKGSNSMKLGEVAEYVCQCHH